ncbi:hypothetical protein E1B28_013168 [Marasmius oreades]|uniref:Peptidase A1 domain-containing protein n=1 Tax=Marasmius oreades TaxID=181124 RepID=A0A9P7RPP0_9AGAR|nr:uncharacterized protein E1B28_013168 [Marasmius oreades]KAG7087187.1 hypothetical protein E1B28_013168 [Marasmius oreades]
MGTNLNMLIAWTAAIFLLPLCTVAKTWVSLPVHAPARIEDDAPFGHQVDVAIGTPPQNSSFNIGIQDWLVAPLVPQCIFCPVDGMYDPNWSTSFKVSDKRKGSFDLGGLEGNETFTLGGVLQDLNTPMIFIDQMGPEAAKRFSGGILGLAPTKNESLRGHNILVRLDEQGQLLNPVWGLRLGGDNPRLTIGALDPNEYEGELNWVPELNDTGMIKVDAYRGYQGNILPFQYPVTASLSSVSKNIYLPEIMTYLTNESLIGPQEGVNLEPDHKQQIGIQCNGTQPPQLQFSVDINGINYPINQHDLIRPPSIMAAKGFCNIGVYKADPAGFELGVVFLRSVYLAYRFPTGDCPGYYGFAFPKGSTTTSNQKPRDAPPNASQCLSLVQPTSTPTPTIAVHEGKLGFSEEKFRVYGKAEDQWVALRGVGDLPALTVRGVEDKSVVNGG